MHNSIIYKCKLRRNWFHCPITFGGGQELNVMLSGDGESCWLSHRNLLPGHRMEFRAINQEGENLSTEGETEDSVKACSGEITEKVTLVSTSVLNIAVSYHGDTRHRCFQNASCCCFFSEFGLQSKDTVLCIDRKTVRSTMVLSLNSFNWSPTLSPAECSHLEHWSSSDSMLHWVWEEKGKSTEVNGKPGCFDFFFLIFLNTLKPWCFARQAPCQHNGGEIKSGSWGKLLWGRTTTALA